MAGTFYEHRNGSIAARFHQSGEFWMWLALRLHQPGTTETDVNDQWTTVTERTADTEVHRLKCRMSPCFCPFRNMIAWLESICRGVQMCEWSWDGEGPEYALRWEWSRLVVIHNYQEFSAVRLERAHLVRALYCAFRRFALSSRYRPEGWESSLSINVLLEKTGQGLTAEELRGRLILHDADTLNRALAPIALKIIGSENFEPREKFRTASAEEQALYGHDGEQFLIEKLVDADWDLWPIEQRRARLDEIFASRMLGPGGTPLRELRSSIVEEFLAADAKDEASAPTGGKHVY